MATKKSSSGPSAFVTLCTAMIAGTTKDIVGKNTTVSIAANGSMTAVQINAKLGQTGTLYGAVIAARTAYKQAMAAWTAAEPGLREFVKEYEASLKALFGAANPLLEDFGLTLKARATPSVETKAKALAERRLTMGVRGPTGKARQAITTSGSPGLVLVSPTGQPISGALAGPIPPGSATPAETDLVPASTANGSSSPAAAAPASSAAATPANGTSTPNGQ